MKGKHMWNIIKYIFIKINFALFLIFILFSFGCQPTPENTAVVYGGELEEKIKSSSTSFAAYNIPMSWQEMLDMKGSDTKIEINAPISIPNVTAIPIYKVKQTKFDDTRIESLVNYFTEGSDVIKYTEPTKAELEKQLIWAKQDNDVEMVEELEKLITTAPETVESETIVNWNVDQSPAGSFSKGNGEYAGLSVSSNRFSYMNGYIEPERVALLNDKDKVGELAISEEDAIAAAQNMLHELGVDYMVIDSLEKAQCYSCLSSTIYAEYSEKPTSKGYLIKFARNIDGIAAITNNGISFFIVEEFDYKAPLYPEEIQVYVDDTGQAQSFVWSQPLEIEEKITENVGLLPFENIKQRIRDMLTFINSYDSDPTKVTSIKMNMTIVNIKDHLEEAMYIPAWFVNYTKTYEDIQQESTLVLNAIDGGRVLELPVDISPEIQEMMDEDAK